MTASAVDRNTTIYTDDAVVSYPVKAATTIYLGCAVAIDATGYLVNLTDTAAVAFVGIAGEGVDNSDGANGALLCSVRRRGLFAMVAAGLAVTDPPCDMWWSDNQTVTKSQTNLYAGKLVKYSSATVAIIDIGPATGEASVSDDDQDDVGVAANKAISAAGVMVALDADGYLVEADDVTAVSFWGISLEAKDNTGGADGAIDCLVKRSGLVALTGAGLAATDVGKEVWLVTDSSTVTTTPGDILVGIIDSIASATAPTVRYKPMPIVGQRVDRRERVSFMHSGATLNTKLAFADREFPRKYRPISMFLDAETAPGGTDVLTATLSDGTTSYAATITGAATHGENKVAGTTAMKAAFDTDLTLGDTSTTTADVKGEIEIEYL